MAREHRSLHVVVISQDVTLLHDVSWTLEAVGYEVETSTDFDQDALWRRYSTTDFLIVDGRSIADPVAATFAHDSESPLYRIFLYDPARRTDFAAWYTAGAHDGLRTPVSRGELLARVRTGARFLEFERRLETRSSRSTVPGMYSRRGFVHKLHKVSSAEERSTVPHGLLITAIDWYSGIRRRNGQTASCSLVSMAARAIKRAAGDNSVSAYLGNGRFVTLLKGQSPAAIRTTAESLAKDFSSRESHHESTPRPTLTSAIVPWSAEVGADRILSDAQEALDLALLSGSDCIVLQGEFGKELAAWKTEMSTGNPFSNVVAQDIMNPLPIIFQCTSDYKRLSDEFLHSDLDIQPYVDQEGKLLGIAAASTSSGETHDIDVGNGDYITLAMPETIRHDATFPEIYEAFSSRGCANLIVTAEDRPLGYVTFDGFLSMIDPITTESFAHTDKPVDDLAHLVVPTTTAATAQL